MKIQLKLGTVSAAEVALFMNGELIANNGAAENNSIALLTNSVNDIAQNTLFIVSEENSLDEMMAAAKKGAYTVLCTKAPASLEKIPDTAVIVCDNINYSIERFAKQYAKRSMHKTIALTGSKGKTRTGEFVYSVLEEKYNVFAEIDKKGTEKDDVLALLNIPANADFFLTELKIRDKKDIARLANVFDSDVGIITELKSGYGASANVDVLSGVKAGGEIAFCADDDVPAMLCRTDISTNTVCVNGADATLYAENVLVNVETTVFDIVGNDVLIKDVEIPFVGDDNIKSALFAALVGLRYGVSTEKIRMGLKNCHSPHLGVKVYTVNGVTFIVDTSSATADSVKSGIDAMCDIAKRHRGSRKLALLGDIRDFGQITREVHEKMGEYIVEKNVDKLFTFGIAAEQIGVGARRAGMKNENVFGNLDLFSPQKSAADIAAELKAGDILLIRIGRQNAAEEIERYLCRELEK